MTPTSEAIVCPRCGERLPPGFTRCDACGAYLPPSSGQAAPREGVRRGAAARGAPVRAGGAPWLYLVAGLVVGGLVGYALHTAVGPRQEDGAPTGPSDVMTGAGTQPGATQGGQAQMPAEVTAAVQRYRQSLARDPDDLEANIGMGNLLFDSGQYDRAIEHYTKALAKDPKNPDVRVDRAIAYHSIGQDPKARDEMLQVTREHPKHPNAWLNLGVVSMGMGDRSTATRAWEQYLELQPNGTHAAAIRDELKQLKSGS